MRRATKRPRHGHVTVPLQTHAKRCAGLWTWRPICSYPLDENFEGRLSAEGGVGGAVRAARCCGCRGERRRHARARARVASIRWRIPPRWRSSTRGSSRVDAGKVHVELLATHPARARAAVARRGGRVEAAYGRVIEALVPARALTALARSRDVRFVREPVRPVPESVRGQGVAATRRGPLAQGRSARSRREDRRRRPRVRRVPPEPGHRRSPGLGGQGRLLRAGRLRRDEPRHRRRRDRGGDGARREALPRVHQGRRRARPRRRLRARPRNPDHQPLRELVQHEPR